MDLTVEKFDDLLRLLLERAKTNRQALGYKSERFSQIAMVVGPNCERSILPLHWDTGEHKRAVMYGLTQAARAVNASAVVLIVDTRWTDSDKFSAYFKIPDPKEIGMEKWMERHEEIRMRYGNGDMAYLPREVWQEAVCVVGKGPLVGTKSLLAPYREMVGDGIEWTDEKNALTSGVEYVAQMLLIDDWWTEATPQ